MRELDSRSIPYEQREVTFALNRPPHLTQPWPTVGQRVLYRRHDWSTVAVPATILEVQDPDDYADPWLWHTVRDPNGNVVLTDDEVPLRSRVADPWPWVRLRPDDNLGEVVETREGRLRGSAGWLPLSWRPNPVVLLPHQMTPPPLRPLVPASAINPTPPPAATPPALAPAAGRAVRLAGGARTARRRFVR